MNRCTRCLIPDTRPDTAFEGGVCSACIAYANRPAIDWEARRRALVDLLDRHHGECIVPSSGGKDSTAQVIKLKELGAHVTVVTATTCMLTAMGRANIDNLARHATTIEVTPNRTVRAKLNRLGLERVGDISWPEHVAIFTIPFNVATELGQKLMFYGENPQNQYGGPPGTQEAREMTQRWVNEFGGFLGLRVSDMVGVEGITERDMADYRPHSDYGHAYNIERHFLGQYLPWDSHENGRIAEAAGMKYVMPCEANWWAWENQDNAMTGIHDHFMFRKYGYGRGCAQISVDVRAGLIERAHAATWVEAWDGRFPMRYMGVPFWEVLEHIGMPFKRFDELLEDFTTKELFQPADYRDPGDLLFLREYAK